MTTDLLSEANKMRRVPGIVFAGGPTGRRARIAGTGIEVFEVISVYHGLGDDAAATRAHFNWLSDTEIAAALNYFAAFPEEIETRLAADARFWEWFKQHAPLTPDSPPYPGDSWIQSTTQAGHPLGCPAAYSASARARRVSLPTFPAAGQSARSCPGSARCR